MSVVGCATPQYALRQTPVPEESASAVRIEQQISALQAREFEEQGARPIGMEERVAGFGAQRIVDRLSRVTERPSLRYRTYLYEDEDPNAAALADGRIYLSTGLLHYLEGRGGREDESLDSAFRPRSGRMPSEVEAELAFILGHELAHTVAQHLVKRYRSLQRQQLLMAAIAAGASAATRNASASAQQAGRIAVNAASILRDVHNSGYSQEQELEADQLGIQYVMRAGYEPNAALDLLQDFARFDSPMPIMRTHPYITLRREYLQRYLAETGQLDASRSTSSLPAPARPTGGARDGRVQRLSELRAAQRLYPAGSISWTNLQRQIERLERDTGPAESTR